MQTRSERTKSTRAQLKNQIINGPKPQGDLSQKSSIWDHLHNSNPGQNLSLKSEIIITSFFFKYTSYDNSKNKSYCFS